MKNKRSLISILAIVAFVVIVIFSVKSYGQKKPVQDIIPSDPSALGTIVNTPYGVLAIQYRDGAASLSGELMRQAPCANWNVVSMNSAKGISVVITADDAAPKCPSKTALPQSISQSIEGATKNSVYSVSVLGTTLFSGTLSAIVLPTAPGSASAQ